MLVVITVVALVITSIGLGYWVASWKASGVISKVRNEYDGICDSYRDSYRDYSLKTDGSLEDTKAQLTEVTEERDDLDAELQSLKTSFRRWKCRFAGSENRIAATVVQLREAASLFSSDVRALDAWTDAQDEQPKPVTEDSFLADVEAAGLQGECRLHSWLITGGSLCSIDVFPYKSQVHFRASGESLWRLGTVAGAINLAGRPVEDES